MKLNNQLSLFVDRWRIFFKEPINSVQHWVLIGVIALLFILVPQMEPIDWDLNARPIIEKGFQVYSDQKYVYPPWALILMLPYYLMGAAGSRIASILVIGKFAQLKRWSLIKFLAVCLSPHLILALVKSNIDVLVFLFPLILWKISSQKRWEILGRGLAISILLIKPQGTYLICIYLAWQSRKNLMRFIQYLMVPLIIMAPISLVGSPPLILQWLDNVLNPAWINIYRWHLHSFSLNELVPYWLAAIILVLTYWGIRTLFRYRNKRWSEEHTLACLLLGAMFFSSYASIQSFSGPMALLPSWGNTIFQFIALGQMFFFLTLITPYPVVLFVVSLVALYFYKTEHKSENIIELMNGINLNATGNQTRT
jgi:hypothetical protein